MSGDGQPPHIVYRVLYDQTVTNTRTNGVGVGVGVGAGVDTISHHVHVVELHARHLRGHVVLIPRHPFAGIRRRHDSPPVVVVVVVGARGGGAASFPLEAQTPGLRRFTAVAGPEVHLRDELVGLYDEVAVLAVEEVVVNLGAAGGVDMTDAGV